MKTSAEFDRLSSIAQSGRIRAFVVRRPELLWALLSGTLVYFVLAVYQPFGTRELIINYKLLRLSGYGVLTSVFIYLGLARSRRVCLLDPGQQLRQELLIWAACFLLAACLSYLYYCWAFISTPSVAGWGSFLQYFSAIAILPLCLVWMAGARLDPLTQGSAKAAEQASTGQSSSEVDQNHNKLTPTPESLGLHSPPATKPESVILVGENKDERLSVDLASLLWLRGADNYVEVVCSEGGGVNVRLLRSSLAAVQLQLVDTRIVRVHRSHLVNLDRVAHWRGNTQGMKLYLRELAEPIAVSRAYVETTKQALS